MQFHAQLVQLAEDEIAALLMEIVVMLAPRRPAPFGGTGSSPGMPLCVGIARPFRFIA